VGNSTKIKVVKNKVAPPFRTAVVDIMYGKGISKEGEIVDIAVDMDIIGKSGSWYSYNNEKIGQGRENAKNFLHDNPSIMKDVETKIRENLSINNVLLTKEVDDTDFDGSGDDE
jgi:recombination protein RecA